MKKGMIVSLAVIGGLFLCGFLFYATSSTDNDIQTEQKVKTAIAFKDVDSKVKTSNVTQVQAYEKEAEKIEENLNELDRKLKAAEDGASEQGVASFVSNLEDPVEKKFKEFENRAIVRSYKGKVYDGKGESIADNDEDDNEELNHNIKTSKEKAPEIKAATVPVPSKTVSLKTTRQQEVQKKKVVTPQEDEGIFYSEAVGKDASKSKSNEGSSKVNNSINTIKGKVMGDHVVRQGGQVKIRNTEPFTFEGKEYPKNTILFGNATFTENRMLIIINRVAVDKSTFDKIQMSVHEVDMEEGLAFSRSPIKEAQIDALANSTSLLVNATTGGVAGELAGNGVGTVANTALRNGDFTASIPDAKPILLVLTKQ